VPRSTHVSRQSRAPVAYGTLTRSGRPFQQRSAQSTVAHSVAALPTRLLDRSTPAGHRRQPVPPDRFGLLPFRSPLLRESSLFLGVLRCFSSPTDLHRLYIFKTGSPGITPVGLPHSDTLGSALARSSPRRFVAWPRPSSAPDAEASTVRSSCGASAVTSSRTSERHSSPSPSTARRTDTPTPSSIHAYTDASTFWWSSSSRMVLPCSPLLRCKRWS
jgi:hypothetical protein